MLEVVILSRKTDLEVESQERDVNGTHVAVAEGRKPLELCFEKSEVV